MATDSPELSRIAAEALDIAKSAGQAPTTAHLLLATFTVPGAADVLLRERGRDAQEIRVGSAERQAYARPAPIVPRAVPMTRPQPSPAPSRPPSTSTSTSNPPSTSTSTSTPPSTSSTPTSDPPPISITFSTPRSQPKPSAWSLDPRQYPYLCAHGRNL